MRINADFSKRAAVHAARLDWVPSPVPGVDRRMLDRVGEEKARATSLVRYAPDSAFSAHVHGGGEEFLVLEGVFGDEHGEYPPGSYVRNPPQSRHTPRSKTGCTILVKLWQFDPDDRTPVRIETARQRFASDPARPGVDTMPLYRDRGEFVRLERWSADAVVEIAGHDGLEAFVLDGGFTEGGETFDKHSWLRLPPSDALEAVAGPGGATLWIKSGHLARPQNPPS